MSERLPVPDRAAPVSDVYFDPDPVIEEEPIKAPPAKHKEEVELSAVDTPYLILVLLLTLIGLIMVLSSSFAQGLNSKDANPYGTVTSQASAFLIGLVCMFFAMMINYQVWSRFIHFKWIVILISIAALGALLVLPVDSQLGAVRWFTIGGTSVQPFEISKIAVILFFSASMGRAGAKVRWFRYYALYMGILLVHGVLLYKQPHLSGLILLVALGGIMMVLAGVRLLYLIPTGILGGLFVYFYAFEKLTHAARRIQVWKDPWADPTGDGFQMIQSMYAVGSGGMFGAGIGQSTQKYLYLTQQHNDFIFSIICEELGYVGAILILVLFSLLILRGYWIAWHASDRYGMLLASGISTLIALQVFANVAVITQIIPVTGITLPFFSSGGSALVVQLAEVGLVLSVSRQIPIKKAAPLAPQEEPVEEDE
jgi:cell division protein FtsW